MNFSTIGTLQTNQSPFRLRTATKANPLLLVETLQSPSILMSKKLSTNEAGSKPNRRDQTLRPEVLKHGKSKSNAQKFDQRQSSVSKIITQRQIALERGLFRTRIDIGSQIHLDNHNQSSVGPPKERVEEKPEKVSAVEMPYITLRSKVASRLTLDYLKKLGDEESFVESTKPDKKLSDTIDNLLQWHANREIIGPRKKLQANLEFVLDQGFEVFCRIGREGDLPHILHFLFQGRGLCVSQEKLKSGINLGFKLLKRLLVDSSSLSKSIEINQLTAMSLALGNFCTKEFLTKETETFEYILEKLMGIFDRVTTSSEQVQEKEHSPQPFPHGKSTSVTNKKESFESCKNSKIKLENKRFFISSFKANTNRSKERAFPKKNNKNISINSNNEDAGDSASKGRHSMAGDSTRFIQVNLTQKKPTAALSRFRATITSKDKDQARGNSIQLKDSKEMLKPIFKTIRPTADNRQILLSLASILLQAAANLIEYILKLDKAAMNLPELTVSSYSTLVSLLDSRFIKTASKCYYFCSITRSTAVDHGLQEIHPQADEQLGNPRAIFKQSSIKSTGQSKDLSQASNSARIVGNFAGKMNSQASRPQLTAATPEVIFEHSILAALRLDPTSGILLFEACQKALRASEEIAINCAFPGEWQQRVLERAIEKVKVLNFSSPSDASPHEDLDVATERLRRITASVQQPQDSEQFVQMTPALSSLIVEVFVEFRKRGKIIASFLKPITLVKLCSDVIGQLLDRTLPSKALLTECLLVYDILSKKKESKGELADLIKETKYSLEKTVQMMSSDKLLKRV